MAINDFNIGFLGKLDGTRSKNQINQDIEALRKSLNSLEIKATLDPKQSQALTKQLNLLQVSLSDASFSPKALNDLVSQVNNALKGIQISNINTSTVGKSAAQSGQQIGKQIQNGINSAIQKGDFSKLKEYNIFSGNQNAIAQKDKKDFGDLTGSIVTVKEEMKNIDGTSMLNAFTVNLKNAKGEVESLRYSLQALVDDNGNKTGDIFRYTSGSVNDAGAVKQFQQMEKAATDYQNKLDTLKTKYANLNVDYSGFENTLAKFKSGTADANELSTAFNTLNNSITGTLNSLKSQTSSFDQIQQTMNNMRDLPSMIQNLETSMSGLSDKSSVAGISIKDLQTTYSTLLAEMTANGGKVPTSDTWIKSYKDLTSTVAGAKTQVDALVKSEAKTGKSNITKELTELQRLTKATTVEKWYANNTAVAKLHGKELDEIVAKYRELGTAMTKADSDKLQAQFKTIEASAREANKIGFSFTDKLKNAWQKFGGWSLAVGALTKGFQEIKNGISFIAELDDALTDTAYTCEATSSQLAELGNKSVEMAKDLNTSASNILGAVKLYSNANETIDSILRKSKPAAMLSNVSGMSGEESAKTIQSILNQFNLDDSEGSLNRVVDTLESVASNVPADFVDTMKQVSEAISESGAVANDAGISLEKYSSIISVLSASTGLQGSQLGNSLKTIITRTTSASKTSDIDAETLSNADKSLKSIGISVRDTNGEFQDFDKTMAQLSEKWDNLNSVEKSNVSFNLAGTREVSILKSLMQAWNSVEDVSAKASDSQGTALKNQEIYAKSIQGRLGELKATTQSTWNNILDSSELKTVVSALTNLISVIDKLTSSIGGLGTIGSTLGAALSFKKNVGIFTSVTSSINSSKKSLGLFNKDFNTFKRNWQQYNGNLSGKSGTIFKSNDVNSLKAFNQQINSGIPRMQAYNSTMLNCSDYAKNLAKQLATGKITNQEYSASMNSIGISSKIASVGIKALSIAGNALLTWGVTELISLTVKGLDELNNSCEENRKKISKLTNEYSDNSLKLDDINSILEDNKKKINEINALQNPTYVDDKELEKLKQENILLNEKKEIIERTQTSLAKQGIEGVMQQFQDEFYTNDAKMEKATHLSWNSSASLGIYNRSEEHTSELQSPDHLVCR